MKNSSRQKPGAAAAAALALAVLAACSQPLTSIEYKKVTSSSTYPGSGDVVGYIPTSGYVNLTYTLNGLTGQDVYFVFTNTSTSRTTSNPVVGNMAGARAAAPERSRSAVQARYPRVPAHVQQFNNNPPAFGGGKTWDAKGASASAPSRAWSVGQTRSMYDDMGGTVAATVRGEVTAATAASDVQVILWVADANWDGAGTTAGKIWPSMVTALKNKFLLAGLDNDIYDWVTDIFGVPWGNAALGSSNLIAPTSPQEIHILLYDIDGDGAPVGGNAYTVGFFYARDNYEHTSNGSALDKSNELVMFYMDAELFADDEYDDGWLLTDYWPQAVVSTLAHEFQHMIHFYQKQVIFDTGSTQTWLNEMCSMIAEDLVARNMQVDGPRGVLYSDGSAGTAGNEYGRLPYFNYYNDIPVSQWSASDPLASYSINYALGAYLARTYDGAAFFRDVVQCNKTGTDAIVYALGQHGESGLTFGDILQRWGAAVLLSDNETDPPSDLRYNVGDFVTDSLGYKLGSINLYNYTESYSGQVGPYLYSGVGAVGYVQGEFPTSNLYYQAAAGASGSTTWHLQMDSGVRLTVVVKD
jgi:hypothetical protein